MDMLTVKPTKNSRPKNKDTKKLKVVYISSPMKVKTSASRFRSLVQELTGRDSDISRYNAGFFDHVSPTATTTTSTHTQGGYLDSYDHNSLDSYDHSYDHNSKPVDEDQLITHQRLANGSEFFVDNVFRSEMFDDLDGIFPSCSLYES